MTWDESEMPNLVSACNTVDLASQSSLLLLLWGRISDGVTVVPGQEFLLGQARIQLNDLQRFADSQKRQSHSFQQSSLNIANKQVGLVTSKIKYAVKTHF